LGLPGAQRLRVEPELANSLRRLQAAAQPCSMLVSLPGLLSLNLFSGKPAPSGTDGEVWMFFLSDSEQAAAVRELMAQPHPCAVYSPEVAMFWTDGRQLSTGPLVRYIVHDLHTQFETGGYRFMVPDQFALSLLQQTGNSERRWPR
jgi:hypothetical protein